MPGDADPNTIFLGEKFGNFENVPNFEHNSKALPG